MSRPPRGIPESWIGVAELNRRVKGWLESEPTLQDVWVRGEISNFRAPGSGHLYFSLKEEGARLRCVMFRSRARALPVAPEDGMGVLARGRVSLYEAGGDYQLYVEELVSDGAGLLYLEFENLKRRLEAEGLFDERRKLPLPFLPRSIGVVTSPTGAALRDILSVLRRRAPGASVLLSPAVVQGEEGPDSVVRALKLFAEAGGVDVVIVGRGGGSIEELWTFNDERVARAIAAFEVPVISAVGHETDFTIADFAADRRAPTPSAAAELVVPEEAALRLRLVDLGTRCAAALRQRSVNSRERLARLSERPALAQPAALLLQQRQQRVDDAALRADTALRRAVDKGRDRLAAAAGKLDALSPLHTLKRGYAIVHKRAQDGEAARAVVRSVEVLAPGDDVELVLADGRADCKVEARRPARDAPGGGDLGVRRSGHGGATQI